MSPSQLALLLALTYLKRSSAHPASPRRTGFFVIDTTAHPSACFWVPWCPGFAPWACKKTKRNQGNWKGQQAAGMRQTGQQAEDLYLLATLRRGPEGPLLGIPLLIPHVSRTKGTSLIAVTSLTVASEMAGSHHHQPALWRWPGVVGIRR